MDIKLLNQVADDIIKACTEKLKDLNDNTLYYKGAVAGIKDLVIAYENACSNTESEESGQEPAKGSNP